MKKASTIMSIALAFALVATAAFAGPASEGEASAATTEQEMVLDPSTGEMVKAPQYGGQLVVSFAGEPPHADLWWGSAHIRPVGPVLEKLGMVDWATPRDKWAFNHGWYVPREVVKPHLAESFETPDPLTIIFKIREGINWHDKAPMNGREFTADDVVFNFHRFTGLGSGFTEASPFGGLISGLPFESIEATDGHTVVVKLKQISFTALDVLLYDSFEGGWIYPPEVIKEHGNVQDWRNLVGTGPYELADWAQGSSLTYTKNPNYWKDDEKFPGNRLPYADEMKILFMEDASTRMAALRTGKLAILEELGRDDAESLQRTDPELVITSTIFGKSNLSSAMDVRQPPFDDIRVRQAMQLAIDNEAINQGLYGGLALTTPMGMIGTAAVGFYTPFAEWPEQVQANYGYDPERAETLLDAAGYPRGADGIRFKTNYLTTTSLGDLEYTQVAKDYWAKIGVDVELDVVDRGTMASHWNAHTYEGMTMGERGTDCCPLLMVRIHGYSNEMWNMSGAQDPEYDAIVEAAENAATYEEMQRLVREAEMYFIKQQWEVWGPRPPIYYAAQPWLGGYNGEFVHLGGGQIWTMYARLWIDQELKESMGH